jgi:hypothetical protein
MSDRELRRLEVLADVEHVMPRLPMSTSSAAPVSTPETPVKTTMKTMAEPAMETVNETMVKMRKPLRYYDRRPEPE